MTNTDPKGIGAWQSNFNQFNKLVKGQTGSASESIKQIRQPLSINHATVVEDSTGMEKFW